METSPDTGAVRSKLYAKEHGDAFPPRYDLIHPDFLRRLAETMGEGQAKGYPPHNWMRGFEDTVYFQHAMNHLELWRMGDKTEDHLAHAAFNIMGLMFIQDHMPELVTLQKAFHVQGRALPTNENK